ncbi:hypothetical protein FACS189427_08070 [Planctomycetales bacterium]|nr:hypothetical protein FACS189427_08070 [Planctomycetales bacterium]
MQANRLNYLEEDENFWPASAPSLGPDGVCGPCSEIYHDTPVGAVEIWNLVFTQFNRDGEPPNNLRPRFEVYNKTNSGSVKYNVVVLLLTDRSLFRIYYEDNQDKAAYLVDWLA